MANLDSPRGLWAIRHLSGANVPVRRYAVDASNSTAVYRGDLVKIEADGNVAPAETGAGASVIGVVAGCYDANKKPLTYLPATTAGYVDVWDDPDTIFGIQADGATAQTDIGATKDHVAGAGSTLTGISAHELDSDGTEQNQLKIIGKVDTPDNDWGANVDVEVLIVEHHYRTTASI